jgi:subtilase family serine protease
VGETSSGSTSLIIPSTIATGNYYIVARADAAYSIAESNELNNTRAKRIAIGPDLTISSLAAPSTAARGTTIALKDRTKNLGGGADSVNTVTRFYLSLDKSVSTDDMVLGTRTVPALGPGASDLVSTTVTIPAAISPGTYYILARADDGAVLVETNEKNNLKAIPISITP